MRVYTRIKESVNENRNRRPVLSELPDAPVPAAKADMTGAPYNSARLPPACRGPDAQLQGAPAR
ncbi:hypothetical protein, partial [Metapseudomonas otitidis]|uniref:hypothetical protein n=1 Tax=Metapseudomonas otitidis TaxID=319939 RepID=UPI00280A9C97